MTPHGYWDLSGWSVEGLPRGSLCDHQHAFAGSLEAVEGGLQRRGRQHRLNARFVDSASGCNHRRGLAEQARQRGGPARGTTGGGDGRQLFRTQGTKGHHCRNVALAPKEIKWELSASANPSAFVDLVFTPKYGAGTVRRARVRKGAFGIDLRVWTLVPASGYPNVAAGDEIRHFQQFYSLYTDTVIPTSDRYRMYLKNLVGGGVFTWHRVPARDADGALSYALRKLAPWFSSTAYLRRETRPSYAGDVRLDRCPGATTAGRRALRRSALVLSAGCHENASSRCASPCR